MGVRKMREIKFRAWDKLNYRFLSMPLVGIDFENDCVNSYEIEQISDTKYKTVQNVCYSYELMQYTGLKDKNGSGLTEVYEGDIISIDGNLKGNIYENDKEPTDIVIPQIGTKAWADAYKEAVERGYNYSE